VAKYHFNDQFKRLYKGNNKTASHRRNEIEINETDISHFQDRDFKFKYPKSMPNRTARSKNSWTNIEDEHFMVWF
jgi:hypothetical protein